MAPLWDVSSDQEAPKEFTGDSAYAALETGTWGSVYRSGWRIGFGSGLRDAYDGNSDAAQMWLDLQAGAAGQVDYSPAVTNTRIEENWFGIGRDFRFRTRRFAGQFSLFIRGIQANDLLIREMTGDVTGEDFSGAVKIISSEENGASISGRGWAIDCAAFVRGGARIVGRVSVEGLFGQVTWRQAFVQDFSVISPQVFEDREGFLRDIGGAAGAEWREDITYRTNPLYRADVAFGPRLNLLAGTVYRKGTGAQPHLGVAWPQRKAWMPYCRAYPTDRRLEIGAVGRGWRFSLSGDDWIFASPKRADVALSLGVAAF